MAKLELRDLFLDPAKPEATTRWDTVTLNVEVSAGDYNVIRSKVGRKLIYTVKYNMVEDPSFRETPESPDPPAGQVPKRWDKMYRCHFNLSYKRPAQGAEATSPISNEENVTYPNLFPEEISMQPPPEGSSWPKDPFYRIYKNYAFPEPTPSSTLNKCDLEYMSDFNTFIQKLFTLVITFDIDQKIRAPNETAPPPPPEGQPESDEEIAKMLLNYIKLHPISDQLRAEYKILTVKEEEQSGQLVCAIKNTETKKIALRSLGCTEENKDDYALVDIPIVRF